MERHNSLNFKHLENFNTTEGYWSTEDCILVAKSIINITKAKSMLEIGFNIGYSAAVWITSGINRIMIIDINNHADTQSAIVATINEFPNTKIEWWFGDSMSGEAFLLDIDKVELAFIDGEHSYIAALSDTYLSITNGAKWLVYDDVIVGHENGINDVITRLSDIGLISVVKRYPMPWTQQGEVVLAMVNHA